MPPLSSFAPAIAPSLAAPTFATFAPRVGEIDRARLRRRMGWMAFAVLVVHGLAGVALREWLPDLPDLRDDTQRPSMQVTWVTTPAPVTPPASAKAVQPAESMTSPAVRSSRTPPVPATPAVQPKPITPEPTSPLAITPPAPTTPPPDWRADIARGVGQLPPARASAPAASAERVITDQSQRPAGAGDDANAPGSAAQRAFDNALGSGRSSVSGPSATREGGNPLGTRECIEMNGKKRCARYRNQAADIDPFMKRERLFSPDMR
ncbi:hypothetical protein [Pandoraea norimbergensis]|uniref:hypothetical protein n=1 Tax=Pandoraea norimbergensis TaxID=93219 RepID=UPI0012F52372|nr:hypothetical protein [Pandoraea norimbergensis]